MYTHDTYALFYTRTYMYTSVVLGSRHHTLGTHIKFLQLCMYMHLTIGSTTCGINYEPWKPCIYTPFQLEFEITNRMENSSRYQLR